MWYIFAAFNTIAIAANALVLATGVGTVVNGVCIAINFFALGLCISGIADRD